MSPTPSVRRLGLAAVGYRQIESGLPHHKWFTWFPPPPHYLEIGFVHRFPRPWTVASIDAPRWAGSLGP